MANELAELWNKKGRTAVQSRGIPKDVEQAREWGSMLCIPPEFCDQVYMQAEGRDWVDGAGLPITRFTSYLNYRWAKERGNWRTDGEKKESTWSIMQRLNAVREELKQYIDDANLSYNKHRGADGRLKPEAMVRLKALRKTESSLVNKLTGCE